MNDNIRNLIIDLVLMTIGCACGVALLATLSSCANAPSVLTQSRPVLAPPHSTPALVDPVIVSAAAAADSRVNELQGQLDTAQRDARDAHAAEAAAQREAQLAPVRAVVRILEMLAVAVAALGAAAGVALRIAGVPFGGTIAVIAIAAGLVVFGVCLAFGAALTHPFACAAAVITVFAGIAIWFLWHHVQLGRVADEFRRTGSDAIAQLEARGEVDSAQAIKRGAEARQKAAGVWRLIDRTLVAAKARARKVA